MVFELIWPSHSFPLQFTCQFQGLALASNVMGWEEWLRTIPGFEPKPTVFLVSCFTNWAIWHSSDQYIPPPLNDLHPWRSQPLIFPLKDHDPRLFSWPELINLSTLAVDVAPNVTEWEKLWHSDWFKYQRQVAQLVEHLTRNSGGLCSNFNLVRYYFSHPATIQLIGSL